MLGEQYKAAVRNGKIEAAKRLYDRYIQRYSTDPTIEQTQLSKELFSQELLSELLKNIPDNEDMSGYSYLDSLTHKICEYADFMISQGVSLKGIEKYLGKSLLEFCAEKGVEGLNLATMEMPSAENFKKSYEMAVRKENYKLAELIKNIPKYRLSYGTASDAEMRHALQIIRTLHENPFDTPKLIADVFVNFKHKSLRMTNLPEERLRNFCHFYQDAPVTMFNGVDKILGKPIGIFLAEMGLVEDPPSSKLSLFLEYEGLREIAKLGNVEKLKKELALLTPRFSAGNAMPNHEEIFNGVLTNVLKNKQWEMAAYLFDKGASVPSDAELGENFLAFVKKHQIKEIMATKRYQFYHDILESFDAETIGKLNGEVSTFEEQGLYPDAYVFEQLYQQWESEAPETEKSDKIRNAMEEVLYAGLKSNSLSLFQFEKISGIGIFEFISRTGFAQLLDAIPGVVDPFMSPEERQGMVSFAFINGNTQAGMGLLKRFFPNPNAPYFGPLPIHAKELARVIVEKDYVAAKELIDNYHANIDFSELTFNEFQQFKGDLIAWLEKCPDIEATVLLECPRIKAELEKKKQPQKENTTPQRVSPVLHTQQEKAVRPLPPPPTAKENLSFTPKKKQ